ncbi:GTP pyrophosphokinase, partial [Campylobacter fetus]|nr:GTP pyrophosphokinase [Campylobacter fetus]
MADEQNEVQKEEIVILEKDDGDITPLEDLDKKEEQVETPKPQKKPKKNIFIIAAASGAIALILLIAIILLLKKDETKEQPTKNLEQPKQTQVITQKFSPSKIDDMLKKANSLYESGNKFEALKIYENVAIYNEALSNYNLGVSQMNQSKFEDAISSFKKAIENNENTSVSALNAAVSALEINNEPLFKYYIELANAFLSKESDSSLYDYYNALINYYKGYYIEALHILDSSKNRYYEGQKNYLRSKILSYIYQDKQSIKALENTNTFDTNIPMGLLYARLGEYDLARKYLNKALVDENNADSTKLALALIDIKTGQFGSAALNLKDINDKNSTFISQTYPIKTILNPELFDINMTQKKFSVDMLFSKDNIYQILFYFTPYKVFDAKQTINYIRKGGISVFIDENTQADEYLKTSGAISKVNLNLSKTIATALNYNLREANKEFLNIIKIYSGHSILHYNLALTYA